MNPIPESASLSVMGEEGTINLKRLHHTYIKWRFFLALG